jgi:3' terminal RNA ribose 2'-O-methyltransferase Hen1
MLAVALGSVFRTALRGRSDSHPDLAARPIPLRIDVPTLPCRGDADLVTRLFEPLGWSVRTRSIPLDPAFPEWGDSRCVDLRLTGTIRLADALRHLYVLLPVLDDAKHYWVGEDEVDKLLRAGEGWLADHPERRLISDRYLAHQKPYVHSALDRLAEVDEVTVPDDPPEPPLAVVRRQAVLGVLRAAGARRVLDLGCGPGALLRDLLAEPSFTEIVGVDVSTGALAAAERRLDLDRRSDHQRARITLRQSALTYTDETLAGYDAAVLMEVIEHVDPERLPALERSVFGTASPDTVVVTTPNAEHNVRYPHLPAGRFRHADHRFEWNRTQFTRWAAAVADAHGYTVRHHPVGADDPEVGPPTQLAEFTRAGGR